MNKAILVLTSKGWIDASKPLKPQLKLVKGGK